jgi:hypothetical protein
LITSSVFLFLFPACNPDWDEVVAAGKAEAKALQPQLDKRLAQFKTIALEAEKVPQSEPQPIELGKRPKLHFGSYDDPRRANVIVAAPKYLKTTKREYERPPLSFYSHRLDKALEIRDGMLADYLDNKSIEKSVAQVKIAIEDVSQARYLVVIRTQQLSLPEVTKLNAKAFAKNPGEGSAGSFTPGMFADDALLYDLKDSSLLGGFSLQAKSSAKVEIRGNASFMSDDLRAQVGKDFSAKFQPFSDDYPKL